MRFGPVAAVGATVVGLSVMMGAFLKNASPYATIAEAKQYGGDNVHVAGDIVPGTVFTNPSKGQVAFEMKDEKGDRIQVSYVGSPPSNMGSATKVVAIGGVQEGVFKANRLLIKCPSKYDNTAPEKA